MIIILVLSLGYCLFDQYTTAKKQQRERNRTRTAMGRRNVVEIWDKEFR